MKTCSTCKFWERRTLYKILNTRRDNTQYQRYSDGPTMYHDNNKILDTWPSKFGTCYNKKLIYTRGGGCVEDDDIRHQHEPDALLYSDGEAYGAYCYTGEAFGCVHHEPKEN